MKHIIITFSILMIGVISLMVSLIYTNQSPNFSYSGGLNLTSGKTETSPHENSNWFNEAMSSISKMQYNFSFDADEGEFKSINPDNNMTFAYEKNGFTAEIGSEGDKVNLKIESVSRVNSQLSMVNCGIADFSNSDINVHENKAYIENENLRIDYTNDEKGMRQDFLIKNKPEGAGNLQLNLSANTDLKMITGADALMFKDYNGNDKMKYSSLKCWDATGRELRAYFEENKLRVTNYELRDRDKENENTRNLKLVTRNCFDIVVNDADAIYPVTIDPVSELPDWQYENNQAGSAAGWSVATAGDVNGDGYSDVIVGAPLASNGQNFEGRAYVFHGSASGPSSTPNWTAESDTANSKFGSSVSTAGDVNGDGYSDVIIGAPNFSNGQTEEGKVYVYHGSASGLSLTPNWTIQKNQGSAHVGACVSTAGDVNNDGYSDIVYGAPDNDNGQTDEGKIFIHHGSISGINTASETGIETNNPSDNFGISVSLAGDVNGDGYSDIIAGAMNAENGQNNEGRAFIFKGSSTGVVISPHWSGENNNADSQYGFSVSGVGDVNGDGYSDVIVGAPWFTDSNNTRGGKVYMYYGNAGSMSSTASWTDEINQDFAFFGHTTGMAGDVNGDGYGDIIIGAYQFTESLSDEGKAYVYFGSSTVPEANADWTELGNQISAYYGQCVATAGDVNGDGFSDIIVGAPQFDNPQNNEGMAFLYNGYADGLRQLENWSHSFVTNGSFGQSVSTAGDVNGDGYSDVIVGAPSYSNSQFREGAAFVFHGSANGLSSTPDWGVESNLDSGLMGECVSTAGDVNGDGYCDVIIGLPTPNDGRVYVYHGSASGLSNSPNWIETNNSADEFGYAVSTAGDVNGDGYSDVMISDPYFDNGQFNEGKVFIYYGSPYGLSNTPDWDEEINQANALFGRSVSTCGDVNGDGYSDIIVGAPNYSSGQTNEGAAFAYYGSATGPSLNHNWMQQSNQASANYGLRVSLAGDVNGNGYGDVIVSAPFYEDGENSQGAIFEYNGSSTGLSPFANWSVAGEAQFVLGLSISGAGDVNGDGYHDIVTTSYDGLKAYYGSSNGLSLGWEKSIASSSVSSAGDVNGDGYSDIISGISGLDDAYSWYGNRKRGLRSTVQQYEPGTQNIVGPGGNTESNGNVKLNLFGKSPEGRVKGKIVYEYKRNDQPFSGSPITRSVQSSGSGNMFDLGTAGTFLDREVIGLQSDKEYKWRARVQFDMVKNPYQKFSPWKYYSSFYPEPYNGFKPKESVITLSLFLTAPIEGFYDPVHGFMVTDTVRVYLRNQSSPYAAVDSSISLIYSSSTGNFTFTNASNGTPYYIVIRHRNSIQTWSASPQTFTAGTLNYDFSTAASQAFGSNLKLVDNSPVKYGIFAGDVNQDEFVDLTDITEVYNDAGVFLMGYEVTDVNGDDYVDLSDISITYNNSLNFVSVIKP